MNLLPALQRHFGADLAHTLAEAAQAVAAPAGTRLFAPGAPCRQFLLLLEGTVRVQALSAAGREIVLYRVDPGQTCVMTTSCLLGGCAYLAEGLAETAVRAAVLPAPAFERLLAQSPAFRGFVFGAYAARLADLVERIEEVALERIDARLARLLLRRARADDGTLDWTHQRIATELGSVREVVSRQLKAFEQRGWVALRRGGVVLRDRAALEAFRVT